MSADRSEIRSEDLLDRLIREAEQGSEAPPSEGAAAEGGPANGTPTGASPLGGGLGGLLSNPALWSALPQLLNGLGQLSGGQGEKDSSDGGPRDGGGVSDAKAVSGSGQSRPVGGKGGLSPDRHTALLCALKPYLGRERQQAAEYLISLCRVWGTLQSMGISLPALLSSTQNQAPAHDPKEV